MKNIIEINDITALELDVYARTSEVQLLRYNEPNPVLFIAESPKVIERALKAGYEPLSFLVEHKDLDGEAGDILARYPEIPVYTAEYETLVKMTGYALARGMLCAMKRRTLPSVEEICKGARRIAILENVVNPTNIGAIFRSAAALHMDAVLLTGGCSNPLYRRAARVSMGTVFQIPWTYFEKKTSWPEEGMKIWDLRPWRWHFVMIPTALMIRNFLQKKNLRSFLARKVTVWHQRLLRTVIIRLRFPWLMVWILLMWQLQVLWHSGNWVGNDS